VNFLHVEKKGFGAIKFLLLTACWVLSAMMVSSCSDSNDQTMTRTEYWGVFKSEDGTTDHSAGETSDFSVCNVGYRSTASIIELELWTMVFAGNSVTIHNTADDNLLARGTVDEDLLFVDSIDGGWSFYADYRNAECCFDGTDGKSGHWHGIRMPDYLNPSTIGQNAYDANYTDWFDRWTSELYAQSTVAETEAGPVEYAIIGDSGPVLAFMHGGPGDFYSAMAYFSDLMDKGFRCLTWSRPGFLRTPLSTGTTPESQADALAALLDTLSIDSVAVIGASAGGPPAYQFAIRHPERTWALVQADAISQAYSPGVDPRPGVETWVFLINQDSGMWLYNAMFEYANLGTTRQFIGMMSLLDDEQNDALARSIVDDPSKRDMLGRILLSMGPNSLLRTGSFNDIEYYAGMTPMPLEEISAPTLILHGTADGDVPPSDATYAASKIPGSELYWVVDGIHVATLSENSEAAMIKILDFLNQNSPE
jgi:pimeloyl-ACP methyl ester carboxylesterase